MEVKISLINWEDGWEWEATQRLRCGASAMPLWHRVPLLKRFVNAAERHLLTAPMVSIWQSGVLSWLKNGPPESTLTLGSKVFPFYHPLCHVMRRVRRFRASDSQRSVQHTVFIMKHTCASRSQYMETLALRFLPLQ